MEELRVSVQKLALDGRRPPQSQMLKFATGLIGRPDAESWYYGHEALFTHPHFTEEPVLFHGRSLARVMRRLNIHETTVWAHTHPDWQRSFGVFIVRRGGEIIYEGRSEHEVERLLGLKAKL